MTQYERQKARKSRQSPEKVVRRKAQEAIRRQLKRVYLPLKKNLPLSDAICLEVVGLPTAAFVARIESQWQEGWRWADYGSTNYGGKWNFGHIRPLALWNPLDTKEAKQANHWTNLAAVCARANDRNREIYTDLERPLYEANLAGAI